MTSRIRKTAQILFLAAILLPDGQPFAAFAQQLPATAPQPIDRPRNGGEATRLSELPSEAPVPVPRNGGSPAAVPKDDAQNKQNNRLPPVATPQAELECRKALRDLGAVFKETSIPAQPNGCSLPFPVEITAFGPQTDVTADVTINCAMALAATDFLRDVIQPSARAVFGAPVKSVAQASGYVCRPRNGASKLSEHAFGNALDIAAFTLTTGEVVAVEPSPPQKHAEFLQRVRSAACGPFKTVLGPGSNADHAYHFHFDLAQRRNGGTWCK